MSAAALARLGPGDEVRFRKAPFTGPLVVAWRDDERGVLWTFEAHVGGSAGVMHLEDDEDVSTRKWRSQKGVEAFSSGRLVATNCIFYGLSLSECTVPIQRVQTVKWLDSERDNMAPAHLYSHIVLREGYRGGGGLYVYAGRACEHGLLVQEVAGSRRALVPHTLATILVRLYDIPRVVTAALRNFVDEVLPTFLQPGALISMGTNNNSTKKKSRSVVVASPQTPLTRCRSDAILHAMAVGYENMHALSLTPTSVLAVADSELIVVQNPIAFVVQREDILETIGQVLGKDVRQQFLAADPDTEFLDPPKSYPFTEDHVYTVDMVMPQLRQSRVTTPTGGRLLVSTALLETYFVSRGIPRARMFASIEPGCRVAWLSEAEPRTRWVKHWGRVVVTTEDNECLLYIVPMGEASDHDTLTAISVDTLISDSKSTGDVSVTLYGICSYRHICDIAPAFVSPTVGAAAEATLYVNFKDLGPLQAPIKARDSDHAIVDISAYRERRTAAGIRLRSMILRL